MGILGALHLKARKRHPEMGVLRMTFENNRHCSVVQDSDEGHLAESRQVPPWRIFIFKSNVFTEPMLHLHLNIICPSSPLISSQHFQTVSLKRKLSLWSTYCGKSQIHSHSLIMNFKGILKLRRHTYCISIKY